MMEPSELPQSRRTCPVCGHCERELLYRQRFAEFSSEGLLAGYDVVVCSACGLCFADRVPQQPAFDRYYGVMSKYEAPQRTPDEHDPSWTRLRAVVPFIERAAHPDQSLLEIGCASGQLLHLLRERGYSRLRGVDPSPACAQFASDCYGLAVEQGTFSSLGSSLTGFDCAILIGVLEHICDLSQAIGALRNVLTADGRVFITVPDASHYVDGVDAPFQEFSVEHINFFGPQSLINLMQAHGFEALFCDSAAVHANTTTITPVVHGAFVKRGNERNLQQLTRDHQTDSALRAYIEKSQREHDAVLPILEELASAQRPIVIWGAGAHTLRLLAQEPLSHANVISIIDSNPRYQGKTIGGVRIVGPEVRPRNDAAILVSSRVYQEAICRQICEHLKWTNQVFKLY